MEYIYKVRKTDDKREIIFFDWGLENKLSWKSKPPGLTLMLNESNAGYKWDLDKHHMPSTNPIKESQLPKTKSKQSEKDNSRNPSAPFDHNDNLEATVTTTK